jgi:hypothetical protein
VELKNSNFKILKLLPQCGAQFGLKFYMLANVLLEGRTKAQKLVSWGETPNPGLANSRP